jgi:hypothetical protein
MSRHRRTRARTAYMAAAVTAVAIGLTAVLSATAHAAETTLPSAPPTTGIEIFNPATAPVIKIKVVGKKHSNVSSTKAGQTVVSQQYVETHPSITTVSSLITHSVAGAAAAPNGDIHIRGSHGQYSYYLDGAPLPSNVSGSFSDLINPKSIQSLRVFTGGFPAEFGGQLAAIFDVTAKAGQTGAPGGYLQQAASTYGTFQTNAQVGGSAGDLSYYIAAIKDSTDFRLSPPSQDNYHNDGSEDVGFGKFDYQSDEHDLFTLDIGDTGADVEIPNTPQAQAVGADDVQKETGSFANLIMNHTQGASNLRVAVYSHESNLRYFGSPNDLLVTPESGGPAVETNENESVNYAGVRTDYKSPSGRQHSIMIGFDVDQVKGSQNFDLDYAASSGIGTLTDVGPIAGSDKSAYAQDDWTMGRTLINYGARYDVHAADITTNQLSPRLNVYYTASAKTKLHLFYDHLFQPAAFEDVKALVGNANIGDESTLKPFEPERDNFYEGGFQQKIGTSTAGLSLYYRDEKDTIDDSPVGNTQLSVPVNFTKGYTRGIEFTLDGDITKYLNYYGNYARSWAFESYPVSGGLLNDPTPSGYIPDDHDQTHTASFGLAYTKSSLFYTLDGEYGSGFPYNPGSDVFQYIFTHPHITLDTSLGFKATHSYEAAFVVSNIFNHAFIVKQAGEFSDTEWSQGRSYGVRLTKNF